MLERKNLISSLPLYCLGKSALPIDSALKCANLQCQFLLLDPDQPLCLIKARIIQMADAAMIEARKNGKPINKYGAQGQARIEITTNNREVLEQDCPNGYKPRQDII